MGNLKGWESVQEDGGRQDGSERSSDSYPRSLLFSLVSRTENLYFFHYEVSLNIYSGIAAARHTSCYQLY